MLSPRARSLLLRAARSLLLPLCLGAAAAPSGCQKTEVADAGAPVLVDLSPVPAPEGLVGDLFLPLPEATWTKARALVGGPAAFMPQSFGVLAATLLKLPVTVAGEIDGGVPVLGAVVKPESEPVFGAIGIHVRAGDRLVDQLTRAEDARFTATVDESSHITLLTSKQAPDVSGPVALGVLGNYLLVAESLPFLKAAGPYVARTLPTRTPPKEDAALEIPEAALSGTILENVRAQWARIKSGAGSMGLPIMPFAGIVGVTMETLLDAKDARLTLQLDANAAHARLALTPKPGGGPAEKALQAMVVGDERPLLELPVSTQVGMLWRDSAAARAADASAQAEAITQLIEERLVPKEDKETIAAALRVEGEARGDWGTLGVSLDPRGVRATARVAVTDEEKMRKALKALTDLAKLPGIKARLKESSLGISTAKVVVENLPGDVQRVRFERTDKIDKGKDDTASKGAKGKDAKPSFAAPEDGIPSSMDVLYLVTHDLLLATLGEDPKEALRTLAKAPGDASLGASQEVKAALDALGSEASFTLVADPLRVIAARAGKSAPVGTVPLVFALGKTGALGPLFARLDVPAATLQELIKHRDIF